MRIAVLGLTTPPHRPPIYMRFGCPLHPPIATYFYTLRWASLRSPAPADSNARSSQSPSPSHLYAPP